MSIERELLTKRISQLYESFIGDKNAVEKEMWLYEEKKNKMVKVKIPFIAGLAKLFDDLIGNKYLSKMRYLFVLIFLIYSNQLQF